MPAPYPMHSPEATSRFFWTPAQSAAMALGAVSLLTGLLGFTYGATTYYCVAHVMVGLAGVIFARTVTRARTYLLGGGAVYLALFAYDLLVHRDGSANIFAANNGGNGLHLSLALAMIAVGITLSRNRITRPGPAGGVENTTAHHTAF